jgi:hypothetical protein
MAHFARIHDGIVVAVVAVDNSILIADGGESESLGQAFLQGLYGQDTVWKQTSYNTLDGQHVLGGVPFRANYAGIGFRFDPDWGDDGGFFPPEPVEV